MPAPRGSLTLVLPQAPRAVAFACRQMLFLFEVYAGCFAPASPCGERQQCCSSAGGAAVQAQKSPPFGGLSF